jgi:SAM-dependent methyltransferase
MQMFLNEIKADVEDNYFLPIVKDALSQFWVPNDVCDVGCGNGVFSGTLKRLTGCRLAGVDGSKYALEEANRSGFDDVRHIDDFSTDVLPFDSESFDFVINKDVLEHVLQPQHLVREIARILRREGHVLIHVPNHFPIIGRLKLLFGNSIDPFGYFPNSYRWDFPHIRFFTMQDLEKLFQIEGFELVCDMNWRFFQCGRLQRLIPVSMRKWLTHRYPDAWTEGYTLLFRKK